MEGSTARLLTKLIKIVLVSVPTVPPFASDDVNNFEERKLEKISCLKRDTQPKKSSGSCL